MGRVAIDSKALGDFVRANLTLLIMVVATVIIFVTLEYCIGYSPPRDDVINFYNHAEAMKDGLLPYKDFEFEFPPFSLLFFLIPGLFTSDLNTYASIFGVEVVVFTLVGLYFMLKICERARINRVLVSAVYLALVLIYFTDMMKKFDVIPMALMVASIYFFIGRKFGLAYGLMMFAALVKIYPLLAIPVFLIINCLENVERHRFNLVKGVAACLVVGLVSVLPLMLMSVPFADIMSFVTFHTDRGFQVESVAGVVIQALGLMGWTSFSIVGAHYTWDVAGPLSDAILPYWNYVYALSILAVLVLVAVYLYRERDDSELGWNPCSLMAMVLLVVLTFILTNKVFSTQYMIWVFPFLAVVPFLARDWRLSLAVACTVVFAECCARGILFYSPGEPMFVVFNLARDLVLILFALSIVRGLIGNGGMVRRCFHLSDEPR